MQTDPTPELAALRELRSAWEATEQQHEVAHTAQDAYLEALVGMAPAMMDALAEAAALREAHNQICEIWGKQCEGDGGGDWEDAADDMHNISVAALATRHG